ncbi:MAG: amidohydrolase [Saprospiraceae bacterium]|nr:amidohydrolase [Saprospiraceae bacterium]
MIDLEALTKLRQALHQHPELSGCEVATAARIRQFLSQYAPSGILDTLGKTGLAAIYNFGDEGPRVLFRCELDALPIQEDAESLPHATYCVGVSRKCGHDGHMAIVAGLASILEYAKYRGGKVILLFQPAEETGEGAKSVLEDSRFQSIKPDFVFALHNLPGYKKGLILHRGGTFTAAVTSLIIQLKGIATHAAEPEKGINPALAIAEILKQSDQLNLNDPESEVFSLITPVYCQMGDKAYGMSAGEAELHFTLRAWTTHRLDNLTQKFLGCIQDIGQKHQLSIDHSFLQSFASSQNSVEANKYILAAARINNLETLEMKNPFKWGEDFGLFSQHFEGAIFGIGAGIDRPPLHHEDYDFPDDLIETGIKMFATICDLILSN